MLVLAGAAAWVVEEEPDWYLRARYPLAYEDILPGHAMNYHLDPALRPSRPREREAPSGRPIE